MKNPLNYLSLKAKMSVIALIALAFFMVPSYQIWVQKQDLLAYTQQERSGSVALKETMALLENVQKSRYSAIRFLGGDGTLDNTVRQDLDKKLTEVLALPEVAGNNAIKESLLKIQAKSQQLNQQIDAKSITAAEVYKEYSAIGQELQFVTAKLAGTTGIALDPEAVSYYLYDISSGKLPEFNETITRIQALAYLANGDAANMQRHLGSIDERKNRASAVLTLLEDSITVAIAEQKKLNDEEMANSIGASFKDIKDKHQAAITALQDFQDKKTEFSNVEKSIAALATSAHESSNSWSKLLNEEFEQRNKRIRGELNTLYTEVLSLVVIMVALLVLISLSILKPIAVAQSKSQRIAQNNLAFDGITLQGNNETVNLVASIEQMRATLETSINREREQAASNLRIKTALDSASNNAMIADNDGNIVYANKSVINMLSLVENELRKELPNFSVSKVVGSNFDSFHKNPAHQRNLLGSLTKPYTNQIKVGTLYFRLTANPIMNPEGERIGTVVEWLDRTAEVAAEQEVSSIVQSASEGNFSRRIDTNGKQGFFLQVSNGLNQLLETSETGLTDVVRMLNALSQGDLTPRITADYRGTFGQLKDDSNKTAEQLKEIVERIQESTDAINTAAKEIATGNADLSARTEQQASSLEETASSMEELTSTVKQNAENSRQASQLAVGASTIAVKGGNVVAEVVTTMDDINTSSKKIVDIISVIDGIAFQTNILALNAAVEAARAGEQGRGFAVVASEVRSLAQRSAAAAKEIKSLISDSVSKVENGSRLVEQAGATMTEIVDAVKKVTEIMTEITTASLEQSSGIEQVNIAITQMDEATQQNAALVEEAAAAAESLEEQAQNLSQLVSVFRLSESGNMRTLASPKLLQSPTRSSKALSKPTASSSKNRPTIALPGRTGDDNSDEWEEF